MASGPRSVPHKQAEHMAAPTSMHYRPKIPCQQGAVHTWLEADMASPEIDVRFTPQSGRKWLWRGMSAFDPKRT